VGQVEGIGGVGEGHSEGEEGISREGRRRVRGVGRGEGKRKVESETGQGCRRGLEV